MESGRAVVGLIDYHVGNLQSLGNALDHLGADVQRVSAVTDLDGLTHLLLPGVGAFGFCADRLRASGLQPALERWVFAEQKPMLGICVGMQLLADFSDELGFHAGLGWIGGKVERLRGAFGATRVPHVGWNTVTFEQGFGQFGPGSQADFYFDHSYAYGQPSHGSSIGFCTHGEPFSAVIRRGNLVAAQFHPEKSQTAGMRFLRSFLSL